MEFRFDLHPIFNQSIIKVNSNLLPAGFRGDRRIALDTATKLAEVINEMGEASARAQGLSNPVTTAQKLRMTDQNIYLLGDPTQGKNGAVVGLLKIGKKSLYVFDENGKTQMVNAPCVLDFYVHESRQRSGLGRNLFDTMLQHEEFVPQKLAVDRPSDKLLGFLRKHYGLQKTIPQMNNFVVYDGFFEKLQPQGNNVNNHDSRMHITASPNTALFGPQFVIDEKNKKAQAQKNASNTSIPLIQSSPVGRYAAPRPMGSMAECLSCAEVDQNINRPAPSNVSVSKQMPPPNIETNASSAQVNRISPTNTMLNSRNSPPPAPVKSVPSNASIKRSNSGLNDVAVSNSSIIRQRAAGLPSQNYAQYGDNQVTLSEIAMPAQSQGNVVVNPAEPIGKTNLVMQDIKTPAIEIEPPVENPNEIFHEVCPNCSATFLSTRNSTVKVVQSKVSNANQQTNVGNNQVNDAIIHNTTAIATGEPNSLVDNPPSATQPYHCVLNETNDIVDLNIDDLQISEHEYNIQNNGEVIELSSEKTHDELTNGHRHKEVKIDPNGHYIELEAVEPIIEPVHIQKPTSFPHSKQHTGLKNISYNVSLAVSPTSKMDFVQRPSLEPKQKSPLEDKAAGLPSHDNIDTDSTSSGAAAGAPYTDHGYFDLKFYHNRLW